MKEIIFTGKPKSIGNQYFSIYKKLDDEEYEMVIRKPKKRRSLNQNDLYWKLLYEYARWSNQDINVLHNQMLSSYGVSTGFYAIVPDDADIESRSDMHLKRTSKQQVGKDGKVYVYCQILKGSHELNKEEMSNLITGLKNEIEGSGADIDINIGEI